MIAGDFLDLEETKRLISEVLESAPSGFTRSELEGAVNAVNDMIAGAAMVELWRARQVTFAWRDGQICARR